VFERGTLSILEGPNGAGKSTLLAVIGTALRPSAGSVTYQPFGTDRELARPHIGWVAHDSRCYRDLTGQENIAIAAQLYGAKPAAAWQRVAALLGIEQFAERSVGTLSRGQRQRIALARALVHEPSVLLLDEPWSGLDIASTERLERVVLAEGERGTIVIIVSHAVDLAERLNARRIRLENGRIV
jgi:heme exporter protein A